MEALHFMTLKVMKYKTAMPYTGALCRITGEALTFAKVGSLLRNEVGWVRTGLDRVRRLKLLGQTLDLRQVF